MIGACVISLRRSVPVALRGCALPFTPGSQRVAGAGLAGSLIILGDQVETNAAGGDRPRQVSRLGLCSHPSDRDPERPTAHLMRPVELQQLAELTCTSVLQEESRIADRTPRHAAPCTSLWRGTW